MSGSSGARYQVIMWQRGSYGIVDTTHPIGHPDRRLGIGFSRRRDAEADARRRNKASAQNGGTS